MMPSAGANMGGSCLDRPVSSCSTGTSATHDSMVSLQGSLNPQLGIPNAAEEVVLLVNTLEHMHLHVSPVS